MPNLFEPNVVTEFQTRLKRIEARSPRQWGTMSPAQALAHLSIGLEMAAGDRRLPRIFIGRIIGPLIRRRVFGNDSPMGRNSPTAPDFVIADERDMEQERTRLAGLIDRFVAGGRARCTTHPHPFFGRLTPDQWGEWAYKHLDHHLRQFGV